MDPITSLEKICYQDSMVLALKYAEDSYVF